MRAGGTHIAKLYDGVTLFHGPHLQHLKQVSVNGDVLTARCINVALNATLSGQFESKRSAVNGFAADAMMQAMLVVARNKHGTASLPSSLGSLQWLRAIPVGGEYLMRLEATTSASGCSGTPADASLDINV